jgi:hypothetical protein
VESPRCSYCGAPLEVTPDSVVAVCRYCGRPNFLLGNPAEVLAVPSLTSSDVVKKAVERTKKDLNLRWRMSAINFTSPDLYYLPFYLVDARLNADYKATVVVTYTKTVYVRGQPRTQIVTKTVKVAGRVSLSDVVAVLARRATWGLSADALTKHFFDTAPEPKPLTDVAAHGTGTFLAAEITPERAKAKAVRSLIPRLLTRVEEDAAARAREAVGVLMATASVQDKTVDYEVARLEASRLTYLPLWVMTYLFNGSHYHYYVAGWDGKVVVAEEPALAEHRAASLLGAVAAGGTLGGLGSALLPADFFTSTVALTAGAVFSYLAAGGLLRSRRVEK